MAGKSWKMEVGAGKIIKLQTISGGFPSYIWSPDGKFQSSCWSPLVGAQRFWIGTWQRIRRRTASWGGWTFFFDVFTGWMWHVTGSISGKNNKSNVIFWDRVDSFTWKLKSRMRRHRLYRKQWDLEGLGDLPGLGLYISQTSAKKISGKDEHGIYLQMAICRSTIMISHGDFMLFEGTRFSGPKNHISLKEKQHIATFCCAQPVASDRFEEGSPNKSENTNI